MRIQATILVVDIHRNWLWIGVRPSDCSLKGDVLALFIRWAVSPFDLISVLGQIIVPSSLDDHVDLQEPVWSLASIDDVHNSHFSE